MNSLKVTFKPAELMFFGLLSLLFAQTGFAHGQPCGGPHSNDPGCGGGGGGDDDEPVGALELTIGSSGGIYSDGAQTYIDSDENVKANQGSDFVNFETRKKRKGGNRTIGLSINGSVFVTNNSKVTTLWNNSNGQIDADVIIGRKRYPQTDPSSPTATAELTIRGVTTSGPSLTVFVWFDDDTGPNFANCMETSSDVSVELVSTNNWNVTSGTGEACVRLQDNSDGAISGAFAVSVDPFTINVQPK